MRRVFLTAIPVESTLQTDLTPAQLAGTPTLASVDLLLIDDLSDAEDDAFAAAISS